MLGNAKRLKKNLAPASAVWDRFGSERVRLGIEDNRWPFNPQMAKWCIDYSVSNNQIPECGNPSFIYKENGNTAVFNRGDYKEVGEQSSGVYGYEKEINLTPGKHNINLTTVFCRTIFSKPSNTLKLDVNQSGCLTNKQCANDNFPYCNVKTGDCVECLDNENCFGNPIGKYCDSEEYGNTYTCVECLINDNCPGKESCSQNQCIDSEIPPSPIIGGVEDNCEEMNNDTIQFNIDGTINYILWWCIDYENSDYDPITNPPYFKFNISYNEKDTINLNSETPYTSVIGDSKYVYSMDVSDIIETYGSGVYFISAKTVQSYGKYNTGEESDWSNKFTLHVDQFKCTLNADCPFGYFCDVGYCTLGDISPPPPVITAKDDCDDVTSMTGYGTSTSFYWCVDYIDSLFNPNETGLNPSFVIRMDNRNKILLSPEDISFNNDGDLYYYSAVIYNYFSPGTYDRINLITYAALREGGESIQSHPSNYVTLYQYPEPPTGV